MGGLLGWQGQCRRQDRRGNQFHTDSDCPIVLTGIIVAIALQAAVHAFRNSPDFKPMIDAVEQVDSAYK
jgi:hypothetical protein